MNKIILKHIPMPETIFPEVRVSLKTSPIIPNTAPTMLSHQNTKNEIKANAIEITPRIIDFVLFIIYNSLEQIIIQQKFNKITPFKKLIQ